LQVLPADVLRQLAERQHGGCPRRLPSVTIERDEGEGKYVQIREPSRASPTSPSTASIRLHQNRACVKIKLDAIPADIVESVEINKTLQANMDPDGIGGSVNL